jgi:hypothetical protein
MYANFPLTTPSSSCTSRAGDAEVDDLDRAVPGDEHVLRRDVAVHDPELLAVLVGLAVRVVEPLGHLLHDVRGEPVGDAAADLGAFLHEPKEIDPLQVLHGEVVGLRDVPEIEDLHDVRVVQAERDLGLVDEHPDEVLGAGEGGVDLLDDQELGQPLRDGGAGEEDLRHAAGAEPADQLVFAERLHPAYIIQESEARTARRRR